MLTSPGLSASDVRTAVAKPAKGVTTQRIGSELQKWRLAVMQAKAIELDAKASKSSGDQVWAKSASTALIALLSKVHHRR
jgi:hypothetical protein